MSNRRIFFIAVFFLATIPACVVPGLQTVSVPTFAPTVDTGRVETMVAVTVSAAIAQTEQSRPTQLPTATTAPTVRASPTSEIISLGSTLTVQVDASTVFVDDLAGFEITVPAAWLITRVDEEEYLDAFQLAEAADEDIQKALLSVQNDAPNVLRLFAIDAQEGHVQNGFVTTMKFVLDGKESISLENDEALKASAVKLAEPVPGLEIISTKLSTVNEVLIGWVESKYTIKNSSGVDVVVFQKQAVFNTANGQMTITLSTVEDLQGIVFPVFEAMLETIQVDKK